MKIVKIGNFRTGGHVKESVVHDFNNRVEIEANQYCYGEIRGGDDITEIDPVDLVITWVYQIKQGIGMPYTYDIVQHYRLSEMEIPVEDKDLEPVIIETHKLLKKEYENRNEKGYLIPITTLPPAKIHAIAHDLKKLFQN